MIVSNLYLNCEDALSYDGKPPRPPVDRRQMGEGAVHRVFETAPATSKSPLGPHANPDPRWVCLGIGNDDEFGRFCEVADRTDLAADSRFATSTGRAQHRAELEEILAPVFLTRTAQEWETSLLGAGVGCVVADAMSHFAFLYEDDQAQAIDMMAQTEHPSFGPYWRYAPVIRLSDTPSQVRSYCELGEHTRSLLRELGYDEDQVADLKEGNVVTWPAEDEELATAGS